ncbi:MAG: hypothetical protein ACYC8T_13630 [Myxococcaceae bacterium]
MLLDQAVRCEPMLAQPSAEPVQRHYEALFTRLELLALQEPTLLRRVTVVRGKLAEFRARDRSLNRTIGVVLLAILAALIAAGWLLARSCG